MTLFDLNGKTAIVTGSTKGIGRATANRLAEHGANVVISSRKAFACNQVADDVTRNWANGSAKAIPIPCNVYYKEQLRVLVDKTLDTFGTIDILVCNAAVNPYFGPSADISDEAFNKTMDSNVRSNFWLCNMVIAEMDNIQGGSITIISSIGGLRGRPLIGAYGISKAADMQIARNLATEYGPKNIRANCIAPGLIRTDFARALWENEEILSERTASTPLRRIGEPDEVAGAVVFLASDAGAFVTGETLVIDGGVTVV